MAKIIREVDEQKIQDYEKDIDGILIFVRTTLLLLYSSIDIKYRLASFLQP